MNERTEEKCESILAPLCAADPDEREAKIDLTPIQAEAAAIFLQAFSTHDDGSESNEGNERLRYEQGISRTEGYLKGYRFCRRLLNLKNYEKKYIDTLEWERSFPVELTLAKAKMFEIRHFVLSLPNSDEKMLLYFHYIRGDSVEKCGETMGLSRSTAFRIKHRAVDMAYQYSLAHKLELKLF